MGGIEAAGRDNFGSGEESKSAEDVSRWIHFTLSSWQNDGLLRELFTEADLKYLHGEMYGETLEAISS
jgi:hypothetical protein